MRSKSGVALRFPPQSKPASGQPPAPDPAGILPEPSIHLTHFWTKRRSSGGCLRLMKSRDSQLSGENARKASDSETS